MATKIVLPFNHQPVATSRGTTGTFTCSAGKYARVTVNYSVSFAIATPTSFGSGATGTPYATSSAQNVTISQQYWLAASETLVMAVSNSTGNTNISSSTVYFTGGTVNGTSELTITHSDGVIAIYNASACVSYGGFTSGTSATGAWTVTPNADLHWYAEEYNEIT